MTSNRFDTPPLVSGRFPRPGGDFHGAGDTSLTGSALGGGLPGLNRLTPLFSHSGEKMEKRSVPFIPRLKTRSFLPHFHTVPS
jgi:hypothetical protein